MGRIVQRAQDLVSLFRLGIPNYAKNGLTPDSGSRIH
jgi:hypothetical protein